MSLQLFTVNLAALNVSCAFCIEVYIKLCSQCYCLELLLEILHIYNTKLNRDIRINNYEFANKCNF